VHVYAVGSEYLVSSRMYATPRCNAVHVTPADPARASARSLRQPLGFVASMVRAALRREGVTT